MTNTRARNRLVTIMVGTPGKDASGAPTMIFATTLATVWAARLRLRGGEYWQARQVQERVPAVYNIAALSTVTTAMRLVDGSETFDIKSIEPDVSRREMDLYCEVVS